MTVQTTTHLDFRRQARAALDCFCSVLGGERTIVTYGDLGATRGVGQAEHMI